MLRDIVDIEIMLDLCPARRTKLGNLKNQIMNNAFKRLVVAPFHA